MSATATIIKINPKITFDVFLAMVAASNPPKSPNTNCKKVMPVIHAVEGKWLMPVSDISPLK